MKRKDKQYFLFQKEHYYIAKMCMMKLKQLIALNCPQEVLKGELEKLAIALDQVKEINEVI